MEEPAPKSRRGLSLAKWLALFACVYPGFVFASRPVFYAFDRLHDWWWAGLGNWPTGSAWHRVLDLLGHGFVGFSIGAYVSLFFASIALVPLALLLREGARGRLHAGLADPLERVRRWVLAHPRGTRALTIAPGALWSLVTTYFMTQQWLDFDRIATAYDEIGTGATMGIVGVFATLALTPLAGAALRAFLAPTLAEGQVPQRTEVAKDEIKFAAVAVTTETYAAIVAMVALHALAVFALLSARHGPRTDPKLFAGFVGYMAVAFGGAALFRHASQVAIGVDGVLIKGTSRSRFFAYRELDGVRAEGTDLVLLRRGKVVLRLQLHGDDASKRDAVLARIREAIVCVKEGRGAVSAQIVSSATPEDLARSAAGAADYRGAALTREQLWALVEGPEIEASARRAAAEALAKTSDGGDRARLRVAAEHCAAPEVRVAIARLAEEEMDGAPAANVGLARRSA